MRGVVRTWQHAGWGEGKEGESRAARRVLAWRQIHRWDEEHSLRPGPRTGPGSWSVGGVGPHVGHGESEVSRACQVGRRGQCDMHVRHSGDKRLLQTLIWQ